MNKLLIAFCIVLIVSLIIWFAYTIFTVKMLLDTNDESVVAVKVFIIDRADVYTKDKGSILKIIKYLKNIRYYKSENLEIYSRTPDAYIYLYDKDEKVIDRIKFHGYVAVYKKNKYGMIPFTYSGLEKLCNRLNEKQ